MHFEKEQQVGWHQLTRWSFNNVNNNSSRGLAVAELSGKQQQLPRNMGAEDIHTHHCYARVLITQVLFQNKDL